MQEIRRRIPTDSEGIICGDFNAHSESWGDGRMTQRGAALQAVLDDLDLVNRRPGPREFNTKGSNIRGTLRK